MKRFIVGLAFLTLSLAACGDSSDDNDNNPSESSGGSGTSGINYCHSFCDKCFAANASNTEESTDDTAAASIQSCKEVICDASCGNEAGTLFKCLDSAGINSCTMGNNGNAFEELSEQQQMQLAKKCANAITGYSDCILANNDIPNDLPNDIE